MELTVPTQEVERISADNLTLLEEASKVVIASSEDVAKASRYGVEISARIKTIEDKRVSITKPINDGLKAVNDTFKTLSNPLVAMKTKLANDIAKWQRDERERIAKEEERRNKIAQAAEEKRKEKDPENFRPAEEIQIARPNANIGSSSVSMVWTYEVEDFSKVPDEYKSLEAPRVNAQIRAGAREIPGLKIYQKEQVAFR
jgi:hypothetical protein